MRSSGARPRVGVVVSDHFAPAGLDRASQRVQALAAAGLDAQLLDPLGALVATLSSGMACLVIDRCDEACDALEAWLCRRSHRPQLVVVAKGDSADERVELLAAGADDVVPARAALDDLVVRAQRLVAPRPEPARAARISVGLLVIDRRQRVVSVAGQEVRLRPIGYEILLQLAQERRPLSSREIWARCWDSHQDYSSVALRTQICLLKKALGGSAIQHTEGMGYHLVVGNG